MRDGNWKDCLLGETGTLKDGGGCLLLSMVVEVTFLVYISDMFRLFKYAVGVCRDEAWLPNRSKLN